MLITTWRTSYYGRDPDTVSAFNPKLAARKRGDDRFANGAGGAEDDDLFLVLDVGISDRIFLASKELDMVQMAQLHEPILEALERGDAKRAAQLLRGHSLGFAAQVGAPRPELTLPARKISR
jgi:hypothetical protein